jgi:hypothetical protein
MSHFPVSCRAHGAAGALIGRHRKFTSGDGKWAMLSTYMASQSASKIIKSSFGSLLRCGSAAEVG